MKKALGFTFIELIVVISILGILAAIAIPRFISVQSSARVAVVNGMVGALNSAVALVQAQYKINGDPTATSANIDGHTVSVAAGTGIPTGASNGIGNALQSMSGYTVNFNNSNAVTFRPSSFTGTGNCAAIYNGSTGVVTSNTTDC